MKLVTAIIKPFKLDEARNTLHELDINGLTVTEVKGYGRQKGHTELYRGAEYIIDFLPKIKLEIIVNDDIVNRLLEQLSITLHTGKVGDGKIWVTSVEKLIRVRTGESGKEAI